MASSGVTVSTTLFFWLLSTLPVTVPYSVASILTALALCSAQEDSGWASSGACSCSGFAASMAASGVTPVPSAVVLEMVVAMAATSTAPSALSSPVPASTTASLLFSTTLTASAPVTCTLAAPVSGACSGRFAFGSSSNSALKLTLVAPVGMV